MKKLSLTLAFLFFLTTSVFAQQGLQKIRIDDFTGGMDTNSLPRLLKPNQGASLVNTIINRPGRISKRGGLGVFASDVGSTAFRGLGRFDPDAATSYLVAASGAYVVRGISTATTWTVANASSGLTANSNTEFVQADKLFFILNGVETSWWDGVNFVRPDTGSYPASPPVAKTGVWLRNYLFLAGNATNPDWVYFSNNLEPTVYDATDIIKINTGDGQAIQNMLPFKLNEVIIYKERSIYNLDITGATPLTGWTVQPMSTFIGLIAPRAVASLGNDQWFLSSNPIAVRSLVRSEFDKILFNDVSQQIRDVFDGSGDLTINVNQVQKSAAIFFNDKFMLAIPTGTSTINNTVLVFDFLTNGWYYIDGWYPAAWEVFDEKLYFADASDGTVKQAFTSTFGDFGLGPHANLTTASSPTVATCFEYVTRDLDFDNPENCKYLDAIEVDFEPTGNYEALVSINLDNDGWASIGTVNLAGNSVTLPVTLPTVLDNEGVARKTFQLTNKGEFRAIKAKVFQCGLNQNVKLQRITFFGKVKPWRREGCN